jgi:hypothetical protein
MARFQIGHPPAPTPPPPAPFDLKKVQEEIWDWMNNQNLWNAVQIPDEGPLLIARKVEVTVANWANKVPVGQEYPEEVFQEVVAVFLKGTEEPVNKEQLVDEWGWTKKIILADNMETVIKNLMTLEKKNP